MEWFLDLLPFGDLSRLELGFWSFLVLLGMIFIRAPIGLAMMLCGFGGWYFAMNGNPTPLIAKLRSETYTTFSNYSLTIIPMFLLMGQFATLSGMSSALFRAAESFIGHRKGGVAMAAVGACAGFGAICGSSLATAATMSKVALPELRRYGYSGGFSTATLAAGGTLTEVLQDSATLLLPTTAEAIDASLSTLSMAPILDGYRGKPGADRSAIVDTGLAVQDYVTTHANRLEEVEITPLICTPDRAVAADALIRSTP